ncbi:PaaX family transcriptional regulator C-terminal domain-containing protein [Protaetiibacter mangrovi]|uniref:PadR family transcriptional regulator n=1 Tax=Protaetiibacter mangrovi TaxID=2970926 RepID=A0ABT1ZHX3_9MICO|nr:PaaX family transcriptional regulator C-terminal domain-containing protein [Protaetiibacter mangrovi]MCS0500313.1 PadR family transcriptional regulator [Protaetiibacter mangrovi]TPX05087.1 PadR family transcriptional regulator [Schumannella luteola]
MQSRAPKQLLLAFLGEFVLDRHDGPVRASVILEVLEGAGVAAPAARATLDRMTERGLLRRQRRGREIEFLLTPEAEAVLHEGGQRVYDLDPFAPHGSGWTLVTFTLPEGQRTLRHRLRAALTWSGFAPLRDGLWLAPGDVDLAAALDPLRADLPDGSITAFRASELPGFSMARSVRDAWDVEGIRMAHLAFIDTWGRAGSTDGSGNPISARTMLVADWLALLRSDPRLPREFMDADWPADRAYAVHRARHEELDAAADEAFARLVGARDPGPTVAAP